MAMRNAVANAMRTGAAGNRTGSLRRVLEPIGIGVAYFAAAKVGLMLASINPSATPIWPPTGLALAAVMLWGYRVCPAIFAAALLANATTAGSIYTSSLIACGNTLECLVGGYLVHRWSGGRATFDTPAGVTRFALISLAAATPISASIGVGSLLVGGFADMSHAGAIWTTWWLGDLAGALVIAPVIVLWVRSDAWPSDRRQLWNAASVIAGAAVIGLITFSPLIERDPTRDPLAFLCIVPLLWAALRLGQRETATVALVLSCFALWGTMSEVGPFARSTQNDSFLLLLMFMISTTVPSLILSADVSVRKRAEQQQKLLTAELDHRVKNTFAVVQALAAQTARGTTTPEAFRKTLDARLGAMARTHDLLRHSGWEGALLGDVARETLAPYAGSDGARLTASGPSVRLAPAAATTLTMAIHELATNAVRHGALSMANGRIVLDWRSDGELLRFRWTESGGPPVQPPAQRGFGTRFIEQSVAADLEGVARFEFAPGGLVCTLDLPLTSKVALL